MLQVFNELITVCSRLHSHCSAFSQSKRQLLGFELFHSFLEASSRNTRWNLFISFNLLLAELAPSQPIVLFYVLGKRGKRNQNKAQKLIGNKSTL